MFIDNRAGQTLANGQPMAPGSSVPFDFRTQFVVGQMPVPNVHPALALMLMAQGSAPVVPGQLSVGRDAQKVQLVLNHPNVSGRHATFQLGQLAVVDHGSTAGTIDPVEEATLLVSFETEDGAVQALALPVTIAD